MDPLLFPEIFLWPLRERHRPKSSASGGPGGKQNVAGRWVEPESGPARDGQGWEREGDEAATRQS